MCNVGHSDDVIGADDCELVAQIPTDGVGCVRSDPLPRILDIECYEHLYDDDPFGHGFGLDS